MSPLESKQIQLQQSDNMMMAGGCVEKKITDVAVHERSLIETRAASHHFILRNQRPHTWQEVGTHLFPSKLMEMGSQLSLTKIFHHGISSTEGSNMDIGTACQSKAQLSRIFTGTMNQVMWILKPSAFLITFNNSEYLEPLLRSINFDGVFCG